MPPKGHRSSKSSSKASSNVQIMTFRPTWEEFRDFGKYIDYIESKNGHLAGICKVIPPVEWKPRRAPCDDEQIGDHEIPDPIQQRIGGSKGVYSVTNYVQDKQTVAEYRAESLLLENTPPLGPDEETEEAYRTRIERAFWKNVCFQPATYGADVNGTITDSDCEVWNINKLGTVLDRVLDAQKILIKGVNTAYIYYGRWKAAFPWHTEDQDLYSINYIHYGAPKFWYGIPISEMERFSSLMNSYYPDEHKKCKAFLRHKRFLLSPSILKQHNIPYNTMLHKEGEIMLTFPMGFHAGFNCGFNVAESTNFATERWIDYGVKASHCYCADDTVNIDMSSFLETYNKNFGGKYEIPPDLVQKQDQAEDAALEALEKYDVDPEIYDHLSEESDAAEERLQRAALDDEDYVPDPNDFPKRKRLNRRRSVNATKQIGAVKDPGSSSCSKTSFVRSRMGGFVQQRTPTPAPGTFGSADRQKKDTIFYALSVSDAIAAQADDDDSGDGDWKAKGDELAHLRGKRSASNSRSSRSRSPVRRHCSSPLEKSRTSRAASGGKSSLLRTKHNTSDCESSLAPKNGPEFTTPTKSTDEKKRRRSDSSSKSGSGSKRFMANIDDSITDADKLAVVHAQPPLVVDADKPPVLIPQLPTVTMEKVKVDVQNSSSSKKKIRNKTKLSPAPTVAAIVDQLEVDQCTTKRRRFKSKKLLDADDDAHAVCTEHATRPVSETPHARSQPRKLTSSLPRKGSSSTHAAAANLTFSADRLVSSLSLKHQQRHCGLRQKPIKSKSTSKHNKVAGRKLHATSSVVGTTKESSAEPPVLLPEQINKAPLMLAVGRPKPANSLPKSKADPPVVSQMTTQQTADMWGTWANAAIEPVPATVADAVGVPSGWDDVTGGQSKHALNAEKSPSALSANSSSDRVTSWVMASAGCGEQPSTEPLTSSSASPVGLAPEQRHRPVAFIALGGASARSSTMLKRKPAANSAQRTTKVTTPRKKPMDKPKKYDKLVEAVNVWEVPGDSSADALKPPASPPPSNNKTPRRHNSKNRASPNRQKKPNYKPNSMPLKTDAFFNLSPNVMNAPHACSAEPLLTDTVTPLPVCSSETEGDLVFTELQNVMPQTAVAAENMPPLHFPAGFCAVLQPPRHENPDSSSLLCAAMCVPPSNDACQSQSMGN